MSYRTGDFPVRLDGAVVGRVTITQDGLLIVFSCTCDYRPRDILRLAAVCRGKYVPLGVMAPEAGLLRTKKSFTRNALLNAGYEDPESFHLIRPEDVYREPGADEPELSEPADRPAAYNDFPDPETYDFDYSDGNSEPAANAQDTSSEPDETGYEQETDPYSHGPVPEARIPDTAPADPQISAEPTGTAPETVDGWLPLPNPGILFEDESIQEACQDIKNALITERDGYLLLAVPVLATEPFPLMPVFCFGSSGQAGGQDCIIFKIKNGNLML